jgi:hypothetical protein
MHKGEDRPMKFFRLIALALLLLPAVACNQQQKIPKELAGNWVTEDERYQGKNLIINPEGFIVLIVDAESKPRAERVESMTSTKEAGVTTYVFKTTDINGAHDTITVDYRAANGGELRLAHPNQIVWRRAPAE